jgi:hypothetical protein
VPYVYIKLISGDVVMLQGQKIEDVIAALEKGRQYVRFENVSGVNYVNPAQVVNVYSDPT